MLSGLQLSCDTAFSHRAANLNSTAETGVKTSVSAPEFVFFIRHGIRAANVGKVKKRAAVLSLPCMNSETGTYSTTTFLTALPLSV